MTQNQNEKSGNIHLLIEEDAKPLIKHEILASTALKYLPENGHVLDLGCGLGQIDGLIKDANPTAKFSVADAYQACLDATTKRLGECDTYLVDENEFDLSEIPDEKFDVVVMSHVLEHLRDPYRAMQQLVKKVSHGGHAIVAVPNLVRPEVMALTLFRKHYVNRGHVYGWDRSHWMNFLERILELDVVEYPSDFIRFPFHSRGPFKSVSRGLARLVPHWSNQNVAVIKKVKM